jgi:Insertion domain in 60S ribosomal protein L10P/60s Acidic ribosomal protein
MEPGKTSFFQALGVPTKIARGTIEITTDLKLVEAGGKVGASEATLLNMLNISPFTYGMKVQQVYEDGQAFSPDVLDIEESQLLKALTSAIATITTISLAANYPTLPSIIHSLVNAYKKAIAVAVETDYSWDGIDEIKDRIANPDAYAVAAPAAATEEAAPAEAAKEEEKPEGMYHSELHHDVANCVNRGGRVRRRNGLWSFRRRLRVTNDNGNRCDSSAGIDSYQVIPALSRDNMTNLSQAFVHPRPRTFVMVISPQRWLASDNW